LHWSILEGIAKVNDEIEKHICPVEQNIKQKI